MKITKRQLRRLIREACTLVSPEAEQAPEKPTADVPVPEDYEAVRDVLEQNQGLVDTTIRVVMDAAGAGCERSTAQAIIDHLQDTLDGGAHEGDSPTGHVGELPVRGDIGRGPPRVPVGIMKGPGF